MSSATQAASCATTTRNTLFHRVDRTRVSDSTPGGDAGRGGREDDRVPRQEMPMSVLTLPRPAVADDAEAAPLVSPVRVLLLALGVAIGALVSESGH
jgi:hypothetical protein